MKKFVPVWLCIAVMLSATACTKNELPTETSDVAVSSESIDAGTELLPDVTELQTREECDTCNGLGLVDCQSCEGRGVTFCDICSGNGRAPETDRIDGNTVEETCYKCHGSGEIDCMDCHGTLQVVCPDCGGLN